jgi:glucoamylase
VPTGSSEAVSTEAPALTSWMEWQFGRSRKGLLASISATGLRKRRPALGQDLVPKPGSVVAAPTVGDEDRPDYFFHWLRDSALVIDALGLMIDRMHEPTTQKRQLSDFVDFTLALTRLSGRAVARNPGIGHTTDRLIAPFLRSAAELAAVEGDRLFGEARFNPDATLDLLKWSHPQFDGPALRALAVMRWSHLFTADDATHEKADQLVGADLGFLLRHFAEPCFDVWEERFGHHYHTRLVTLAALEAGAAWAVEGAQPEKSEACRKAAALLSRDLEHHWSPKRGFLTAAIKGSGLPDTDRDLDAAVILAVLHAHRRTGPHSLFDPRIQATLAELEDLFANEFPINRRRGAGEGILLGRFKADGYYGGGAFVVLCLAAAEFYYRLAGALRDGGKVKVAAENRAFLADLLEGEADVAGELPKDDADRARFVSVFARRGDAVMAAFRRFVPGSGDLPEQFDKTSGAPASAENLAWGHAAFIRAFEARWRLAPQEATNKPGP